MIGADWRFAGRGHRSGVGVVGGVGGGLAPIRVIVYAPGMCTPVVWTTIDLDLQNWTQDISHRHYLCYLLWGSY